MLADIEAHKVEIFPLKISVAKGTRMYDFETFAVTACTLELFDDLVERMERKIEFETHEGEGTMRHKLMRRRRLSRQIRRSLSSKRTSQRDIASGNSSSDG